MTPEARDYRSRLFGYDVNRDDLVFRDISHELLGGAGVAVSSEADPLRGMNRQQRRHAEREAAKAMRPGPTPKRDPMMGRIFEMTPEIRAQIDAAIAQHEEAGRVRVRLTPTISGIKCRP